MAYNPTFRTIKTILGVTRQLESNLPVAPTNDPQTTLNHKYSLHADKTFTANGKPRILYFGVGINGFRNIDDTNLSEPHEVRATNMDLYTPLPIRCVPYDQDLSAVERANYRMRVLTTIDGQQYVLYYLKKMVIQDAAVQLTKTNTATGVEEPYTIDYSNLTPTPPEPSVDGTVSEGVNEVNVTVAGQVTVLGSEIAEAINVMYDGNMQYAKLSEIGLYQGEDQTQAAVDYTGTSFNYTEAVMAQLALHRTWNGTDLSTPSATLDYLYQFSSESLVLV